MIDQFVLVRPVSLLLQAVPGQHVPDANPVASLLGSAIGTFLTTLVVGGIMIALAPEYTERKMETVRAEPVESCLYGLASLLFVGLVTFVLVVTIIGILVAIPFVLLAVVIWGVGAAIAFLTVADALVGHEDGWMKPLAVGAGMNGALTLTGIGALVALCVGAAGFGAVLRDWLA